MWVNISVDGHAVATHAHLRRRCMAWIRILSTNTIIVLVL